jgi:hypothetical protein
MAHTLLNYFYLLILYTNSDGEAPTLAFIGMMDVTDTSLFAMADTQAK